MLGALSDHGQKAWWTMSCMFGIKGVWLLEYTKAQKSFAKSLDVQRKLVIEMAYKSPNQTCDASL